MPTTASAMIATNRCFDGASYWLHFPAAGGWYALDPNGENLLSFVPDACGVPSTAAQLAHEVAHAETRAPTGRWEVMYFRGGSLAVETCRRPAPREALEDIRAQLQEQH